VAKKAPKSGKKSAKTWQKKRQNATDCGPHVEPKAKKCMTGGAKGLRKLRTPRKLHVSGCISATFVSPSKRATFVRFFGVHSGRQVRNPFAAPVMHFLALGSTFGALCRVLLEVQGESAQARFGTSLGGRARDSIKRR